MDTEPNVPTLPPVPSSAPTAPAWAPPASNALAPTPPTSAPLEFSPVPERPRRSRAPLFVLVAVVALIAAGIGALVALRDDDGGGDAAVEVEESSAFSLAAAAEQAVQANTVRYEMNMSIGPLGELSMVGGIDNDAQILTFTMDMGAILEGEGVGQIEAIIDAGNGVIYMSNPGMGFPTEAEWVSLNLADLAEQSGMSIDDFQDQFAANPLDVAAIFADADNVVEVGADEIDGVVVQHYVVTVDFAEAMAANPQLEQQVDLSEFGDFPTEIEYDVWVTEDNQLRRMTFALDMLGQEFVVEMNVTDVGAPLDVQIPAAGDVMDMTDFLGGS